MLPESFGNLKHLTWLDATRNQISTFPQEIFNLNELETLYLYGNRLRILPDAIGNLRTLIRLCLEGNNISVIPKSVGNLTNLKWLRFGDDVDGGNQIEELPSSLADLEQLETFKLDKNPLNPALKSAYDACSEGKYEPLFAYLRSLEQNAEPLYEAKLVLVGEGNVGKTTLLKALKGKAGAAPQEHEPTTHGVEIDIHGLRLPHPAKDGVEIQLNAWDFGGQDVYRVTHQFFFSRRSLYLLVWEPRRGVQAGSGGRLAEHDPPAGGE